MTTRKPKRFVLLLEDHHNGICEEALRIAGDEGAVLIARSVESFLQFAKQYKPSHALIAKSLCENNGKFLPSLMLEFSPETEVLIVSQDEPAKSMSASA